MITARLYNRSLIRLILANLLIKPVWILGIDRWVQNEVGLLVYGRYYTVWGLALTAGFLLDLGLTTLLQREAADPATSSRKLAGLFWIKALLLLVYFAVIAGISRLYPALPAHWLFGVAILQALNSTYVFFRAWVSAAQDFSADVWFSVLDKFLLIPLSILWLSGVLFPGSIGIPAFILLQIATLVFSLGALIYYLLRRKLFRVERFTVLPSHLRMALPYALIVLLMSAQIRLDGFFLTRWSSLGGWEAGRYAAAIRLVDAANIVGYLVASFLLPYLSRHINDLTTIRSAIDNARNGLLIFALTALVGVVALPSSIASYLYPERSAEIAALLPTLFCSVLGYSLIHVYGTVLTARGELRLFQLIIAWALLVHILCSYLWIPEMGAMGSARSTLLSQVLTGLALMFAVHRRTGQPQPYSSYLVVIFTTSLIWFLL
ncbi:MAG: hypothetical protein FJX92_01170 [Bacteroidetes bacterium]|nr:hypothetical protein [Bacteroidota bacterium]